MTNQVFIILCLGCSVDQAVKQGSIYLYFSFIRDMMTRASDYSFIPMLKRAQCPILDDIDDFKIESLGHKEK